ncbi:MAG TPA: amino acid adenylation domain-containing protein [Longimicrobiales bacterium]|nr:amino acid adenylation domain-containing protein [Longimicrobiales bacterium]
MTGSSIETAFPLTPLQEGMLYHSIRKPDGSAYWGQCDAVLVGPMDRDVFRRAWERLVRRHQAFRTFFAWEGRDRPLQVVRASVSLPWEFFDWSSRSDEDQQLGWEALLADDRARSRDLTVAPVMRIVLVRLGPERHRLLWSLHHMLADGWSGHLVLKEAFEEYDALTTGSEHAPDPPPSFATFVSWLSSRDADAAEAYWRSQLSGLRAATPLPGASTDAPGGRKARAEIRLDVESTRTLMEASGRMRVTPGTVVFGAWASVLAHYQGETDEVTFGVTLSERPPEIPGVSRSVGLYLSTVPVRIPIPSGSPVSAWLSRLQSTVVDARDHSAGGLADIHRWSELPQGSPLVRSLVVYESFPEDVGASATRAGLRLESLSISAPSDLPLALLAYPGRRLTLELVYDTALYTPEAAQDLLRAMVRALRELSRGGERTMGSIDLLDPAVRYTLLEVWSGADTPAPPARDVLEVFEERVACTPEAPAVRDGGSSLTYAELDAAANRAAHRIVRASSDVEELLGIPADGGVHAIVAVVAALKAGRGYTVLDPRQPGRRLARLLHEVGSVISTSGDARWGDRLLPLDEESGDPGGPAQKPDVPTDEACVAYVVWTSGSTGEPKGVVIERGHLARSTAARMAYYGTEPEVELLMASLAVDSSVAGLYGTLCSGGCLVVPPHRIEQDPDAVMQLVEDASVTTTLMLPSLYRTVLEEGDGGRLRSLRRVVVAGEACPPSVVDLHRRTLPGAELHNEYGPSEATVWATVADLSGDAPPEVTIGRAVPGVLVYLLDGVGRPVPVGVPGEIWIGGGTVARGYLGDPRLTEERFVPDPFSGRGRMYRTGDRGRFTTDGRLQFLGRIDDQLKVRGHRVEPSEVERALEAHPGVSEAAVTLSAPPGARRLVAYLVPGPSAPSSAELVAFLEERLPGYMVPTRYLAVDRLPRTMAGKLDRRRLQESGATDLAPPSRAHRRPRTPTEEKLAAIWKDVLGLEEVDVEADFFELGGDSLLSIRVLSRAGTAGISIRPEDFFAGPTIARLAARSGEHPSTADQGRVTGEFAPAPIQEWFFEHITEGRAHWNQAFVFEAPPELDADIFRKVIGALVAHHDALRLRFPSRGDGRIQQLGPHSPEPGVRVVDLSGLATADRRTRIEDEADAQHRSLDLDAGGLFRAVLFFGESGAHRVLLLAHHLVVDAMSWGILLEDLSTLVTQAMEGAPLRLPPKTVSVQAWSEALTAKATEADTRAALAFWHTEGAAAEEVRERSRGPHTSARVADAETVTLELDREVTAALLDRVPRRLGATTEEILLGALVAMWPGGPDRRLRVDVEGHGRDAVGGLDVSRTVGWFTVVSPLLLSPAAGGVEPTIRAVRDALAGLPGGRETYGLLRYRHPDAAVREAMKSVPRSEILFNYLSTVEEVLPADSPFGRADESTGGARSRVAPRAYGVEVNARVRHGRLTVDVEYARRDSGREEMEELVGRLRRALSELAGDPPKSAGGFELAGLDDAGLSRVADLLAEIDGD